MTKYAKLSFIINTLIKEKIEVEESLYLNSDSSVVSYLTDKLESINWELDRLYKEFYGETK